MGKSTKAIVNHEFAQLPEQVFNAWLDSELVKQWMFPNGDVVRIDIDARVGGSFSFVDLREGEEIDHRGSYLEIYHPRRLAFTWGIPEESSDEDRVEVDIAKTDTGSKLTLTVEMDPNWAEYVPHTEKAWSMMLDTMEEIIK
ncbi:SRPBCC family protein [Halobacillus amylolyticus]|uniref:SRPBCC domain-containing protein n=1 Tax=Halobacillus amylolyticus TaxID=2932259 RepID=A0ABY4H7J8_9BACI|nr:SRPBCC family protein [Halobacillus amylolyticus]UOR10856.1 SRPBCC domain-containing protein [Halobacillus amylolyticus]